MRIAKTFCFILSKSFLMKNMIEFKFLMINSPWLMWPIPSSGQHWWDPPLCWHHPLCKWTPCIVGNCDHRGSTKLPYISWSENGMNTGKIEEKSYFHFSKCSWGNGYYWTHQLQCSVQINIWCTRTFWVFAQQWNGQMLTKAGGNHFVLVCSTADINMSQKWNAILNSSDHQIDPPWVATASAIVQAPCQPIVQGFRFHSNVVVVAIILSDFFVDVLLDALKVGVISTGAQNAAVIDSKDAIDIAEMGQWSVRYQRVGCNDNTFVVLDANHRCTGCNGIPGRQPKWWRLVDIFFWG